MPPELEPQHRKLCAIKKACPCSVRGAACDKNQIHPPHVTPGYQGVTEGMSYTTNSMACRHGDSPITICFKPGTAVASVTMVATIILSLF